MESHTMAAFGLAWLFMASGCASIISGRTAQVKIDSNPRRANVSVRDHEGMEVAAATTPATVSLKRGRTWLRPARYTASISKPGYEIAEVPIRSTLNPWVVGNIAAGGVVGLAVDGTTGAGWKPNPNEIVQQLQPITDPMEGEVESEAELAAAEVPIEHETKTKKRSEPTGAERRTSRAGHSARRRSLSANKSG
jgi:hypothetical protein